MDASGDGVNVVRTLWHGAPFTVYERLSLLSFLNQGHVVEVYSYADLAIPEGVRLCDANEVLPESGAFSYADGPAKGSFAAFSNLFRIKLLHERGGIWADSDFLCLRPLHALPVACVGRYVDRLNGAFLRFPAGHPLCREVYDQARVLGADISLGDMGELVTDAVARGGQTCELLPAEAMYPILWPESWMLVDPEQREQCEQAASSSYCVHWWNTAITLAMGIPKEALPPVGSFLYEHARRLLPTTELAALPIEVVKPRIETFRLSQSENARSFRARSRANEIAGRTAVGEAAPGRGERECS